MKKLYRSRQNRMLGGVCGGIAEYFNIDPVIVRIIAVAFFFMGGSALLAYIIGLIVIPNEPFNTLAADKKAEAPASAQAAAPVAAPAAGRGSETVPLAIGILLIFIGAIFLMHNIPFFHPYYWRVWHFVRHFFWPSLLIALGLFIIVRGWKK